MYKYCVNIFKTLRKFFAVQIFSANFKWKSVFLLLLLCY